MSSGIAAIVPMRGRSERVPGKNTRSFAGRPLYHHIVETLLATPSVERVVIDTDSPEIARDASEAFPTVTCVDRPVHLRGGDTPMNDVLLHTVTRIDAPLYLQTHSTNPLLQSGTIERAIEALRSMNARYDSLFSVTRLQSRLWDGLTRPINHNPAILLRTQDLPPVYEENSCIYLFSREILERCHGRIGQRPLTFEIERDEAWDIDEEVDFRIAELLFEAREQGS